MANDTITSVSGLQPPPTDAASQALMPNLFVIGASKSGSSALHAYMRPHPDICMSKEKEPCFFVDQAELEAAWPIMARHPCSQNWADYLALWKGGEAARYRGEGSVFYSQTPHRSGVPARIAAACPEARILYTVREPVTRAIGHYWQRYKEFAETRDMATAMRENALYRDTSDYALQLSAYLEHFDRDQIFVVVAEDLRTRREDTLARVIDWLGLPPYEYAADEITDRHKSPPTARKERFPLVGAIRDSGAWAMARKALPNSVVSKLRKTATVEFDRKSVDDTEARAYLSEYLAPRTAKFEEMIGRSIDAWR
jgi:hypothetical protein